MGGHTEKAPQGYQPTGQGQADQNYQNLIAGASPWATSLPGSVIPGLQQVVGNVQNNPYFAGQMQGAQQVSNLATNGVAPMQGQAAMNLFNSAGTTAGTGASALTAGQGAMTNGMDISNWAKSMIPQAIGNAPQYADQAWNQTQGMMPAATAGMPQAFQMLMNGFDPQGALYDRNYQQMQDQQNAINSMYGVSGSPYGAGVAGAASRNFNIDWQNNQLSRQLAALQGFGQQQGVVTNNMDNLLNTGSGTYNSLMNGAFGRANDLATLSGNAYNSGAGALNSGINTNANAQNAAAGLYGQASANGSDMLNTLATGTALPNSTYLSNQDAQIAALQALAGGGAASLAPTNNLIDANGNYLQIGQGATRNAQNAVAANNAQASAQSAGIGQALGTLAGIAMAPMTGGMSLFMSGAMGGALGGAAGRAVG